MDSKTKLLQSMGKSLFVSYLYFKNIDSNHLFWKNVESTKSLQLRISAFKRSKMFHKIYLN